MEQSRLKVGRSGPVAWKSEAPAKWAGLARAGLSSGSAASRRPWGWGRVPTAGRGEEALIHGALPWNGKRSELGEGPGHPPASSTTLLCLLPAHP